MLPGSLIVGLHINPVGLLVDGILWASNDSLSEVN